MIESEGSEGAHGHVVCDQAQKIATIDWLTEEGTAVPARLFPSAVSRVAAYGVDIYLASGENLKCNTKVL